MGIPIMSDSPELHRLLALSRADRDHPDRVIYAGLPAFDHDAVLAILSSDRKEAKRLHREYVSLGLIAPPATTSRDGRTVRVQFLDSDRIAEVLKVGPENA